MNSILFKFQENNIKMTFQNGPTTWSALNGKPVPTEENSFVVADEDLQWTWITLAEAQALLGAQGADEKVKYDSADPTSGYLSAKLIAGTNIAITEGTGADENKAKISFTGTIPDQLSDLQDDSTHRTVTDTEKSTWNGKQDALNSGVNIKTINNQSIVGAGNVTISGGISEDDAFFLALIL